MRPQLNCQPGYARFTPGVTPRGVDRGEGVNSRWRRRFHATLRFPRHRGIRPGIGQPSTRITDIVSTPSERQCPIHRNASAAARAGGSADKWPPGPQAGLTGWKLLRAMARDLPGTLAAWRKSHGDVMHLRIWPEHTVVVTDPQLARELLVTRHDALIRWEPAAGTPWSPASLPKPFSAFRRR